MPYTSSSHRTPRPRIGGRRDRRAARRTAVAFAAPGDPKNPSPHGSDGAGDPYFPLAGNGGIDVIHYDLDLDYTPAPPEPARIKGRLDGVATIDLVTTQALDRFNLDLRGLAASSVTIDGESARFKQSENELVISAASEARGRQRGAGRRDLRGHDDPAEGHRGRALRLGHHPRRRDGRERARRLGDVVPRERPPDRQVHVHLRGHRARGPRRRRERAAHRLQHGRRQDDVDMGCTRPDGGLPRHRQRRQLHARPVHGAERHPDHRRTRPGRPGVGSTRISRSPARCSSSSRGSTGRTRSSHTARSSTTTPSATRSRRRRAPSSRAGPARAPSRTSSPTSGWATR